jgi:hypothetical protein
MKPVRDVVGRDVIEDLWGAGYTILPRNRHPDPFYLPPEMVPQGRSYQWMHLVQDKIWIENGWAAVPANRHNGYFMPAGHIGDIEVNGLGLFEKPKFEVDTERAKQVAAAEKLVTDWQDKWGSQFSGSLTVGTQTKLGGLDSVKTTEIGGAKSIEDTTKIPRDMVPYIGQIFEERDYLGGQYADEAASAVPEWSTLLLSDIASKMDAALKDNPTAPAWPTLNAIILPYAIENVRKRIKEASHGQTS